MRPDQTRRDKARDHAQEMMKSFSKDIQVWAGLGFAYDDGFRDGLEAAADRLRELLLANTDDREES